MPGVRNALGRGPGLFLLVVSGLGACGGGGSISSVVPDTVFLGRVTRVTITGNDTAWSPGASVEAGEGVEVGEVVVASPTGLVAVLAVSEEARTGTHEVVVTSGGRRQAYRGGFRVEPPLTVRVQDAALEGSISVATVHNLDDASSFDLTVEGGFGTPVTYPRIHIDEVEGALVHTGFADSNLLSLDLFVDVFATPGPRGLSIRSGEPWRQAVFRCPGCLTIGPREPEVLALPGDAFGTMTRSHQSRLFQLDTPAGRTIVYAHTSGWEGQAPVLTLLPASGRFAEAMQMESALLLLSPAAARYYLVLADQSDQAGYDYDLGTALFRPTCGVDQVDDGDRGHAQPVALPAFLVDARLEDVGDEDWYVVDLPERLQGAQLLVSTELTATTDTRIDVFDAQGRRALGQQGGPVDRKVFGERVYTPPLTTLGRYYVQVTAGSWLATDGRYRLVVLAL